MDELVKAQETLLRQAVIVGCLAGDARAWGDGRQQTACIQLATATSSYLRHLAGVVDVKLPEPPLPPAPPRK